MSRTLPFVLLLCPPALAADRPDILVANFEGEAYPEGWKATGTAFGKGPAKGTLPDQMPVTGFRGKGLVNSYRGGDKATGTLASPAFKVERKYVNFLVGGGKHPKTRIDLLVGGKVVRTTTGPNDKAGGSERLEWHSWDVGAFEGKEAVIEIVDGETGGWGHINVDHVVQSDTKKQAGPVTRTITIEKQYLHLPVKTGAAMRRMKFVVGKDVVREFDIELADGEAPDFWTFADVSAFQGKPLAVETVLAAGPKGLDAIKTADDVPDAEKLYREKYRPLFHFTSRVGWLNDPNGLVFVPGDKPGPFGNIEGEWHLFYQHNPFGVNWGNMHWGHAVSKDLVRWKEQGVALYPKKYGDWAFSGSAVVDKANTSGWGTKEKPPLVLAYTSTGRGECIAYSTDSGRTWTEYDQNPVVKHQGRDPKLIWHEGAKHWVMAVYDEHDKKQWIAFYTSPDLKTWTFASRIEGFFECPDLFELPVGEGGKETRWVLYAADGKYLTGDFDGKTFKPDHKEKKQLWHGRFYAAQSFDNAPPGKDGRPRRVQIGWGQGVTFPGMPFNQQMVVPVELRLLPDKDGPRLAAWPVPELDKLRQEAMLGLDMKFPTSRPDEKDGSPLVVAGDTTAPGVGRTDLDAFDLEVEIDLASAEEFGFILRGTRLTYDVKKGVLACKDVSVPIKPEGKTLRLRALVDRGSVEVFAEGGRVALSVAAIPAATGHGVVVTGRGGDVTVKRIQVWNMKSGWGK